MKTKILFTILICLTFVGCYDQIEIDDRSFVSTLGVDKEDDKYKLYFSTTEVSKNPDTKEESKESSINTSYGNTFTEAILSGNSYDSKQLYFGQTKAIIFSKDILEDKKMMREVLDTIERNQELSKKVLIFVTEDEVNDVIETLESNNGVSGIELANFYKNNSTSAISTKILNFEDFLINLRENNLATIPKIGLEDEKIKIGGSGVVKDLVLMKFLTLEEDIDRLLILGELKGGIITLDYNNEQIPFRLIKNKSKISFNEDICNIDIGIKGNIEGYIFEGDTLLDTEKISDLEYICSEQIKVGILETLEKFQKVYKLDVLNFTSKMYKKEYDFYSSKKTSKEKIYEDIKFDVSVKCEILGIGAIQ